MSWPPYATNFCVNFKIHLYPSKFMEYWLYRHYSRALQWPHLEFVACFRFHHPLWFMLVLKINLASYAVVSSHKLQSVIAAFCNLLLQQTCIIESHSYHQGYHTLCCPEDLEREARIAKPPQLAHFIVFPILPYLTFLVICIYNRVHSATSQSHRWGLEHQSTGKLRILPLVKVSYHFNDPVQHPSYATAKHPLQSFTVTGEPEPKILKLCLGQ